ncbi:ATP-binding protein [Streptomyces sp. NPDC048282]|uniref:ATP-binding protein n=1 Tax=Streptomyces sp. NPDC048282 TaxID=3365528 RepID=UPI00371D033F
MTPLIGRDDEMAAVDALLSAAVSEAPLGGTLLVRGEPGIGKSALLDWAAGRARERGMLVVTCEGVPSEASLAFAGLHQLWWHLRADTGRLPAQQREALLSAFGLVDKPAPGVCVIALAALELLAEQGPVLVVADDVHWLDRSTSEVLAFLGTRLEADPVVLLAACRDGEGDDNPLRMAGLPELQLGPLETAASAALLDSRARLDPRVRRRVLDEASGNPLALVELAVTMRESPGRAEVPARLPLSDRLEQAYVARLTGLPSACRTALLALALEGDSATALAAAGRMVGNEVSSADLAPAVAAGLVVADPAGVRFRHPLVCSAVRQAAGEAERRRTHAAVAELLGDEPDRRVWHRAAAAVGPDEDLSDELEVVADRARLRGAISEAATAIARAARLTARPTRRGRLLLRAAVARSEGGRPAQVLRLLDEAERLELEAGDRLRLQWEREVHGTTRSGFNPAEAFAELAERMLRAGHTVEALETMENVVMRMWWSNADPRVCRRMAGLADAAAAPDDPQVLSILALADPTGRGTAVLRRLGRRRPGGPDPYHDYLLGNTAQAVGACDQAVGFLAAAADGLSEQGQFGALGRCLLVQAWAAVLVGRLDIAASAADEGGRLLVESGRPFWATGTQLVAAVVAGRRGDTATAMDLAARAERVLLPARIPPMLAQVAIARGVAALGAGRYDEAYEQLARVFDPADIAYHPHLRAWALADYVVAAGGSGHREAARARCAELAPLARTTGNPLLRAGLTIAAPMLADDGAEKLFAEAHGADLAAWPMHRARLQFAYGTWLRRRHQVSEARVHLRSARDAFDALGAVVEGEDARQELQASGEASGDRKPGPLDRLTPQEWQIARLAAQGFTNREIGRRLYLSHRTVGSHLYRIFPKLGIASRSELAAAVTSATGTA